MKNNISKLLLRYANKIYNAASNPFAILFTILIIISWFIVGIPMHFSDLWYKSLHTFELFITLILVFIIEITQKAEIRALQEKLDEIIKKYPRTDNKKASIEKKYKGIK